MIGRTPLIKSAHEGMAVNVMALGRHKMNMLGSPMPLNRPDDTGDWAALKNEENDKDSTVGGAEEEEDDDKEQESSID
jgi:hypothetical protein